MEKSVPGECFFVNFPMRPNEYDYYLHGKTILGDDQVFKGSPTSFSFSRNPVSGKGWNSDSADDYRGLASVNLGNMDNDSSLTLTLIFFYARTNVGEGPLKSLEYLFLTADSINNDLPDCPSKLNAGIVDKPNTQKFSIYPNPLKGTLLNFQCKKEISEVRLYDLTGRELLVGYPKNSTITLSQLPSGIYILKAMTESEELIIERLIIE